jgi:hypothetical protein
MGALWELPGSSLGALWELIAVAGICNKYMYNHVHDATLLQDIMKELAGADRVRKLKDAPAPGTGTAHSVADSVSYLQSNDGR